MAEHIILGMLIGVAVCLFWGAIWYRWLFRKPRTFLKLAKCENCGEILRAPLRLGTDFRQIPLSRISCPHCETPGYLKWCC